MESDLVAPVDTVDNASASPIPMTGADDPAATAPILSPAPALSAGVAVETGSDVELQLGSLGVGPAGVGGRHGSDGTLDGSSAVSFGYIDDADTSVLTMDLAHGPAIGLATRILPDNLIVYTRSSRRRADPPPTPTPAEEFIGKVTKKVDALVQAPIVHKRRAKLGFCLGSNGLQKIGIRR